MLQSIVHYSLHFLVIGLIAYLYDPKQWKKYWLVLLATMLVDLDHLLARPVYSPGRCSIGFHPLHTAPAIGVYALLTLPRRTRVVGIGLLIHIGLDALDCLLMHA